MRALFKHILLFLLVHVCIRSFSQVTNEIKETKAYDYPTTLRGGYKIVFKTDITNHLYLQKQNKIIASVADEDTSLLYKSLGYIRADFERYFVLAHSFGAGNPTEIELLKKATGKNILKKEAYFIDAIETKEILLYCDVNVPTAKQKLALYNLRTMEVKLFKFPEDIFDEPQILNRIKIASLTDRSFTIKYWANGRDKTKTYYR